MSEEDAVMARDETAGGTGEGGGGGKGDVEEGVRTVFAGIQATFQEEVDIREVDLAGPGEGVAELTLLPLKAYKLYIIYF